MYILLNACTCLRILEGTSCCTSFPALKVVQTTKESVTSTKASIQLLRSPHLAAENYI